MLKVKVSRDNKDQVEIINNAIKKIYKIEPAWIQIFQNAIQEHLVTGKPIGDIVKYQIREIRKITENKAHRLPRNAARLFTSFIEAYAITHFGIELK